MKKSIFPLRPMGDLVEKVSRPVEVEPCRQYAEIGIRSHGKGIFDKEPVSGSSLGDKRVFWIEPDCFILNIVFAWERAVARTTVKDEGKIASHRFPMFRPKRDAADVDFLLYFFLTELGKELLELASPGGAGRNKTLGQNEFYRIRIPCPPFEEQRRIAEILLTWDRAIGATEKLIANSQAQKNALMQQLLTGKKRLPGFNGEWRTAQLGTLGVFIKGTGISRSDLVEYGLPAIRYGEIYTMHNYIIESFGSFIPRYVATQSTRLVFGDIIFTCSGETTEEIGKCVAFLGGEEAYAGGDTIILRNHLQSPEFLSYALNSEPVCTQKAKLGQGNSVVHISARNLASIVIGLPPPDEQKAIASLLCDMRRGIARLQSKLAGLKREKSALMQQLLTGKRRVKLPSAQEEAA